MLDVKKVLKVFFSAVAIIVALAVMFFVVTFTGVSAVSFVAKKENQKALTKRTEKLSTEPVLSNYQTTLDDVFGRYGFVLPDYRIKGTGCIYGWDCDKAGNYLFNGYNWQIGITSPDVVPSISTDKPVKITLTTRGVDRVYAEEFLIICKKYEKAQSPETVWLVESGDIENLRTAVTGNISLIWEQLGKLKYVCSVRAYYADSPVYENIGYIGTYDGEYYIYDGLYGGAKLDMSKFPEPVYP